MGDAKELPSLSNLISQFPSIAFQPLKLPPLRFMLALTKPIANAFELLISKPSFLHNSYIRTITLHLEEKGSSLKFHPFLLPSLKASKEKHDDGQNQKVQSCQNPSPIQPKVVP
jgi:hypothetical protein